VVIRADAGLKVPPPVQDVRESAQLDGIGGKVPAGGRTARENSPAGFVDQAT
jgi:hypothetical protein